MIIRVLLYSSYILMNIYVHTYMAIMLTMQLPKIKYVQTSLTLIGARRTL